MDRKTAQRSVATDALATLGMLHDKEEKRDAIHLAVMPVEGGERLLPGEPIRVENGIAYSCDWEDALGIVDPFLQGRVPKGARFWFIMMPRQVHSLRHVWSHPAFPDEVGSPGPKLPSKEEAELWLEAHASLLGTTYDRLMARARNWLDHQGYWVTDSESEREDFDKSTFWRNYEIVTGITVPSDMKESFISCNCG